MPKNAKESAIAAASEVLRPLAELFIELGVTSPEVEALVRSIFVQVAYDTLKRKAEAGGKSGRISYGRVGLLAGVHRNEVASQLQKQEQASVEEDEKQFGANRVLHAWHHDRRFSEKGSGARVLPLTGKNSFEELVRIYWPGVVYKVVLQELLEANVARLVRGGKVRATAASMGAKRLDSRRMAELGKRGRDMLNTMIHNVMNPTQTRMADTVLSKSVSPRALALLRKVINENAELFLDAVEAEVTSARLRPREDEPKARAGVTVFYFEDVPIQRTEEEKQAQKKPPPAAGKSLDK